MHEQSVSRESSLASPTVALSDCCWAPRRLRIHHVLDDYGAQGKITTTRWVICEKCREEL